MKQTAQQIINSIEEYGIYSPEDWEELRKKVKENGNITNPRK